MLFRAILFCLLLVLLAEAKAQQPLPDSLVRFIQHKGDSLHKAANLPGLFIGVMNGGQRQYFNFGYAVPDEGKKFNSTTVFEAGSITKTFTAYIVEAVLKEKGIADSSSILPYLPDSVRANKALAPITFLSLLNHTSGLPRLPTNMQPANPQQPYADYTTANLFSYLKTATPQPDGKSNYSNLGAGLAGVLAQCISSKKHEVLLNEYIFLPFAMKASNGATLYTRSQGYMNGKETPYWMWDALAGAGSLQLTAAELLSYLEYMSQPRSRNAEVFINGFLQPTVRLSPNMQVARGWHTLERKDKPTIYWHNGGTYGFSTFAAFVKGTEQAVVVVVNRFNTNNVTDALGMAIMRRLAP